MRNYVTERIIRRVNTNAISYSAVLLLAFYVSGCGGSSPFVPPAPLSNDDRHVSTSPESRNIPVIYDAIDKAAFQQIKESLDLSRQLRRLAGKPKQAYNINAFGEVDNSSWFTNRNATSKLSIKQITRGPDTGDGPDVSGTWTIIRAKLEGVTPGFTIRDGRGETYLIKFDPKGYSELATGAEMISTKLFSAAGFNTPENYLTYFDPGILRLADNVKFTNEKGDRSFMAEADLEMIFSKINILPDGRIRALASKYLPGKPIGPFTYQGFRDDDPNDFIPHQHRRELRGLRVICAWLKHTDTKDGNTLDSYVTENDRSYVRHYLIDFGSTLGSAAHGPFAPEAGHVYHFDPIDIITNTVTLGLAVKDWEKHTDFEYTAIGRYRSDTFEPYEFKNLIPNPAFELITNLDGYWGAKIVMSFTDEQLAALIKEAEYSDPEAERYLLKILKERRDIIGRKWFSLVNPLDHFQLEKVTDGRMELRFTDLAIEGNLEARNRTNYSYDLKGDGVKFGVSQDLRNSTSIVIPEELLSKKYNQIEITIRTERNNSGKWSKWVKIYLQYDLISSEYSLIGLRRQE
ncbi:MAG: hypothetical protein V3W18_11720 [candidate division Zixibacteria bacterium]